MQPLPPLRVLPAQLLLEIRQELHRRYRRQHKLMWAADFYHLTLVVVGLLAFWPSLLGSMLFLSLLTYVGLRIDSSA